MSCCLAVTAGFIMTPNTGVVSRQPTALAASRRQVLTSALVVLPTTAATATPEPVDLQGYLDFIRNEMVDPAGGVAYLQSCIDKKDFTAIFEFTPSYDQKLRKGGMGKAKKFLEDTDKATSYANGVTFDLIGMNRNSRPGKENAEQAQKYLQELKTDVQKFLDLFAAV
jgi:hypothetical protein